MRVLRTAAGSSRRYRIQDPLADDSICLWARERKKIGREKKILHFWEFLKGSQDQDPEESIMKRPVRHSGEIQNLQQGLHVR